MQIKAFLSILVLLCCSLMLTFTDDALAARLGGGSSFGSKPFMSTPAPAPRPQQPAFQSKPNPSQPQAQPAPAASRPGGLFGGMGGLMGGLLAGTLIGSLLGGHGFAGGGFMDILLFGLVIFIGLKLFAAFRGSQRPAQATAGAEGTQHAQEAQPQAGMMREDNAANGWDALRGQGAAQAETPGPQIPMPPGFDADEFLRGAKMAYSRLQASWDKRDMNDIVQFTTEAVQKSVREQMAADPKPSTTEILLVNAQLLGVTNEGDEQYAQVFFDVLLRETPAQETPSSAREVWHFVRPVTGGNWKLDGIQQVD